ncbi:hypothetical protein BC939DRAFT_518551 [Gamsiella multidivaricata]|uniref:uncharacterized protein n=1 Tax=Gamsiella multidivaricata TaxID=101098 RepID=UPI00221F5A3E|nr:uncharacterized protein BC939DRAFT_518551 [Gamsiella multidivaricata]KAI7821178.1 hypothetical protein BC939DRAFT_518551 [Gamsiella multidivaricata]
MPIESHLHDPIPISISLQNDTAPRPNESGYDNIMFKHSLDSGDFIDREDENYEPVDLMDSLDLWESDIVVREAPMEGSVPPIKRQKYAETGSTAGLRIHAGNFDRSPSLTLRSSSCEHLECWNPVRMKKKNAVPRASLQDSFSGGIVATEDLAPCAAGPTGLAILHQKIFNTGKAVYSNDYMNTQTISASRTTKTGTGGPPRSSLGFSKYCHGAPIGFLSAIVETQGLCSNDRASKSSYLPPEAFTDTFAHCQGSLSSENTVAKSTLFHEQQVLYGSTTTASSMSTQMYEALPSWRSSNSSSPRKRGRVGDDSELPWNGIGDSSGINDSYSCSDINDRYSRSDTCFGGQEMDGYDGSDEDTSEGEELRAEDCDDNNYEEFDDGEDDYVQDAGGLRPLGFKDGSASSPPSAADSPASSAASVASSAPAAPYYARSAIESTSTFASTIRAATGKRMKYNRGNRMQIFPEINPPCFLGMETHRP